MSDESVFDSSLLNESNEGILTEEESRILADDRFIKEKLIKESKRTHHFTVTNKDPGKILTGSTTIVEMDGKPIKGLTSFEFKVDARSIATVKLEMIGDFSIQSEIGNVVTKIVPLVPSTQNKGDK